MAALWPTPGLARGESAFRPAPPTGIIIADWQVCAGLNWDVCKESSAIMADEYQLAMLRDGVRPWNLWRKANPEIAIVIYRMISALTRYMRCFYIHRHCWVFLQKNPKVNPLRKNGLCFPGFLDTSLS